MSRERLAQIVTDNVRPRVIGLSVHNIGLTAKPGRCVYVITVPEAVAGYVHQAANRVFYRRHSHRSLPMDEYEIRQAYGRSATPSLRLLWQALDPVGLLMSRYAQNPAFLGPIRFNVLAENLSDAIAEYAVIRVFVDSRLPTTLANQPSSEDFPLRTSRGAYKVKQIEVHWNAHQRTPLFRGAPLPLMEGSPTLEFLPGQTANHPPIEYVLAWTIQAPRMPISFGAFTITVDGNFLRNIAKIDDVRFQLPIKASDDWLAFRSLG
jgi:hypothetical protein